MNPLPLDTALDLTALRDGYRAGAFTPAAVVDLVYRRIDAAPDAGVWIHRVSRGQAMARARELEDRRAQGASPADLPLYGVPFAVKDNFDVAGAPTTAACPAYSRIAGETAFAVRRVLDAGGILVGKTNMDQFATGLVGTRSPYGKTRNPFDPAYISGGSSSGSAVAVAVGLVSFALGTDTAGSGRVPAAFNNIVGLKPTRGLVSCSGVVPACRSLDCVSIFTLTVEEARSVLRVIQGPDPEDSWSRWESRAAVPALEGGFRFGVPARPLLRFFGDEHAPRLYAEALERLESMGGERVEVDFSPFLETAELLYDGPFVAERLEASLPLLEGDPGSLHPVIHGILQSARRYSALDLFRGQTRLQALRKRAAREWRRMDVLALPTAGTIYSIAEVEADPLGPNANLGYYTNFVNLLDAGAVSLPAGFRPDGLPFGVTLIAPSLEEDFLCDLGAAYQQGNPSPPGAPEARPGRFHDFVPRPVE